MGIWIHTSCFLISNYVKKDHRNVFIIKRSHIIKYTAPVASKYDKQTFFLIYAFTLYSLNWIKIKTVCTMTRLNSPAFMKSLFSFSRYQVRIFLYFNSIRIILLLSHIVRITSNSPKLFTVLFIKVLDFFRLVFVISIWNVTNYKLIKLKWSFQFSG